MKTRAKFRCWTVVDHSKDEKHPSDTTTWNFDAVYHEDDPTHENSKFCKYTPSGTLQMSVDNDHYQGEHPVPGKEYYLDISEAE